MYPVIRIKADGDRLPYRPTADTDAARGVVLASAVAALESGDVLRIQGTFLITATLAIGVDNVSIIGDGWQTAVIKCSSTGAGTTFSKITLAGRSGVALQDFKIESLNETPGWNGDGIVSSGTCTNNQLRGVWVDKLADCISLGSTSTGDAGFSIHECRVTGPLGSGIKIAAGSEYHGIIGTRVTGGNTASNIYGIFDSAGNNTYIGCRIDNNYNGIKFSPGSNHGHSSWTGGSINHSTGAAILIDGTSGSPYTNGFQFIGTSIYGGDINLFSCKGIRFSNCNIDGTFRCDEATPKNLVGFNYITDCNVNLSTTTAILTTGGAAISGGNAANLKVRDCLNVSTGAAWSYSNASY